jgi:hypothetical protein
MDEDAVLLVVMVVPEKWYISLLMATILLRDGSNISINQLLHPVQSHWQMQPDHYQ